ncbi:hypothetical protein [Rubripirellula reticaptiva]|uniref:Uncharacterized protein n=1 Tax=Rubripirellula reticaptiva TaxID=2528013 RepID=A0A5C6FAE7_9BACT|nr:hypothetical protein [Rubripirellula reticaptiva]TWU57176.1 hypothetical protein Poly59_00820 [Rubripirellula reticaptiva]
MTSDSTTDSKPENTPSASNSSETLSPMGQVPQMHAETGYDESELMAPLRFSGYVCLILGLISPVALLGLPALVVPALAIFMGLIALRPSSGPVPAGRMPAQIGIILAIGFGICGFGIVSMKKNTLGTQAKYYSREYISLVANGHKELPIELSKSFNNRFSESMPLKEFYENQEKEYAERQADGQGGGGGEGSPMEEFQNNAAHTEIIRQGPDAEWKLATPIEIYHQFGIDRAIVNWKAPGSEQVVQFMMQYLIDGEDVGQWHVDIIQIKRERLVAESIL